ncbi:MAG TPA: low affinity iron permease family protein [Novosphingobium sp.]|nr:low affinity iron permease family protein [Novosphingobium sp.]HMP57615.1 low affinity iron permease family protein [Novosphingobium sp.]
MDRIFTVIANRTAAFVGQPLAFVVAVSAILLWSVSGPFFGFSDTWQLVVNTTTTIITFLIVFLIQNSQNRDAAAIQAKLDELIRVTDQARNQLIGIEHLTDMELNAIREALEQEARAKGAETGARHAIVDRLIDRR